MQRVLTGADFAANITHPTKGTEMIHKFLTTVAASTMMTGMAMADYSLTILHTNDFHARFEPISKYDSGCSSEDNAEGNASEALPG